MKKNEALGILKVGTKLNNGAYICLVSLGELNFDTYQRKPIKAHVESIANGWDDMKANLLKLNIRDGKLYCFDGRQTSAAAAKRSMTKLEAIVFEGLTFQQEANLFFTHNDVPKKMNGWKKFFSAIAGGNLMRAELVEIVHRNNLTLPNDPNVHKMENADVTSSRALVEAWKIGGYQFVNKVCRILDKAWRDGSGKKANVYTDAKKIDMLRGLMNFLRNPAYSFIPDATILKVLKVTPPSEIRALANQQRSKGRIDAAQISAALVKVFITPKIARKAA